MSARLLRTALLANALFSTTCGIVLLALAAPLAAAFGDVAPGLLRLVGAGLLPFAAFILWGLRQPTLDPRQARLTSYADLAWVVGSALVLVVPLPLSAAGRWSIAGVALVVLAFALLQLAGLRRYTAARSMSRPA